jgi:hypothetical protein
MVISGTASGKRRWSTDSYRWISSRLTTHDATGRMEKSWVVKRAASQVTAELMIAD